MRAALATMVRGGVMSELVTVLIGPALKWSIAGGWPPRHHRARAGSTGSSDERLEELGCELDPANTEFGTPMILEGLRSPRKQYAQMTHDFGGIVTRSVTKTQREELQRSRRMRHLGRGECARGGRCDSRPCSVFVS